MVGFHVLPWAFREHCQSCSLEGVTRLNLANQSLWPSSWLNGWETCSSVWIDFTWVGHRLSNLHKLFPGPTLGYGAKVPQKGNGTRCPLVKDQRRKKESEVAQSCPTLCDPVNCSLQGSSGALNTGKNTGVGYYFLLQGIFPTQGSNPGLPHWRQML